MFYFLKWHYVGLSDIMYSLVIVVDILNTCVRLVLTDSNTAFCASSMIFLITGGMQIIHKPMYYLIKKNTFLPA